MSSWLNAACLHAPELAAQNKSRGSVCNNFPAYLSTDQGRAWVGVLGFIQILGSRFKRCLESVHASISCAVTNLALTIWRRGSARSLVS